MSTCLCLCSCFIGFKCCCNIVRTSMIKVTFGPVNRISSTYTNKMTRVEPYPRGLNEGQLMQGGTELMKSLPRGLLQAIQGPMQPANKPLSLSWITFWELHIHFFREILVEEGIIKFKLSEMPMLLGYQRQQNPHSSKLCY